MKKILWSIYSSFPETLKSPLRKGKNCYPVRWVAWKFFQHPNPKWYINERQLKPHYRDALRYLSSKPGNIQAGDYLEFGVCHGSSMLLMYEALQEESMDQMRLFGFDSFEGLPEDDEGHWTKGSFSANENDVLKRFSENNVDLGRVHLIKGFYSDTLNDELLAKHDLKKAGVIMIDCDMYTSTIEALEFCEPLIQDEVVMVFDDWNPLAQENKGEKRAFDEFLEKYSHFNAEEIGNYSYRPGDLHGKVFKISRAAA